MLSYRSGPSGGGLGRQVRVEYRRLGYGFRMVVEMLAVCRSTGLCPVDCMYVQSRL